MRIVLNAMLSQCNINIGTIYQERDFYVSVFYVNFYIKAKYFTHKLLHGKQYNVSKRKYEFDQREKIDVIHTDMTSESSSSGEAS